MVSALAREFKLKRALDKLPEGLYDRVIDCPPSLDLLTFALTAAAGRSADACEYYALEGLATDAQHKMVQEN